MDKLELLKNRHEKINMLLVRTEAFFEALKANPHKVFVLRAGTLDIKILDEVPSLDRCREIIEDFVSTATTAPFEGRRYSMVVDDCALMKPDSEYNHLATAIYNPSLQYKIHGHVVLFPAGLLR